MHRFLVIGGLLLGIGFLGQPNGLDLGLFSEKSHFSIATQVSYASRGIANIGRQTGSIADNVGNTQAPILPNNSTAPKASK